MADPGVSIDPIARALIAQCRREIAAAWEQIEAARATLRQTGAMFTRWKTHGDASDFRMPAARSGQMFTPVPDAPKRRRGSRAPRRPAPEPAEC